MSPSDFGNLVVLLLISTALRYFTRRGAQLTRTFNVRLQRLAIFWIPFTIIEGYLPWHIKAVLAVGLGLALG